MYSQLFHYPVIAATFNFSQVPLKKKLTERVAVTAPINNFKETKPILCRPNNRCSIQRQQLLRIHDLNGTKGLPSLQELYDLRPCYLRCFRNLWEYNDCFHHQLTSNLFTISEDEIEHDILIRGIVEI